MLTTAIAQCKKTLETQSRAFGGLSWQIKIQLSPHQVDELCLSIERFNFSKDVLSLQEQVILRNNLIFLNKEHKKIEQFEQKLSSFIAALNEIEIPSIDDIEDNRLPSSTNWQLGATADRCWMFLDKVTRKTNKLHAYKTKILDCFANIQSMLAPKEAVVPTLQTHSSVITEFTPPTQHAEKSNPIAFQPYKDRLNEFVCTYQQILISAQQFLNTPKALDLACYQELVTGLNTLTLNIQQLAIPSINGSEEFISLTRLHKDLTLDVQSTADEVYQHKLVLDSVQNRQRSNLQDTPPSYAEPLSRFGFKTTKSTSLIKNSSNHGKATIDSFDNCNETPLRQYKKG